MEGAGLNSEQQSVAAQDVGPTPGDSENDAATAGGGSGRSAAVEPSFGGAGPGSFGLFATGGLMLSAGLVMLAPLLPGEYRKLLLYPVAVAAAEGWILALVADAAGLSGFSPRRVVLYGLALVLMLLTAGGVQLRIYNQWQATHPATVEAERLRQLTGEVVGSENIPAEVREHFALASGHSGQDELSVSAWLRNRVSRLGEWPATGAALFFAGEFSVALLAGMWVFRNELARRSGSANRNLR